MKDELYKYKLHHEQTFHSAFFFATRLGVDINNTTFSIGAPTLMIRFFFFWSLLAFSIYPTVNAAQAEGQAENQEEEQAKDEKEDTSKPQEITEEDKKAVKKKRDAVTQLLYDISEYLEQPQRKHLYLIYNNYNLIRTVQVVQGDVSNAITACSAKNPDMETKMRVRFTKWNETISPLLDEAETHIDTMILAQDYAKKENFDALFEAVDQTRDRVNSQIQKVPVTTPEACEYLLNKMSETQERMTEILSKILISLPKNR